MLCFYQYHAYYHVDYDKSFKTSKMLPVYRVKTTFIILADMSSSQTWVCEAEYFVSWAKEGSFPRRMEEWKIFCWAAITIIKSDTRVLSIESMFTISRFRHLLTPSNFLLKAQSCKLYNSKHMITLTQITNTDIFAFIAILVFKLLSYWAVKVCI